MGDIDQMLDNAHADSWNDLEDDESYTFENPRASPLERFEAYVDYCFDTYSVVADTLDREQIQACVADWDRRRGQCRYNALMDKRTFGKRVVDSAHRNRVSGNYAIFVSKPLIGVLPEDDNGYGWKQTVRHELGHAIDYQQRGTSDHSSKFKAVMAQFGHDMNDGQCQSGYAPRYHR